MKEDVPYKHLSSTTLITGLIPFGASFGVVDDIVGAAPASEPSPRKSGPSSHFVSCAASRIVNGRTRTVTDIDEAEAEGSLPVAPVAIVYGLACGDVVIQIQSRKSKSMLLADGLVVE